LENTREFAQELLSRVKREEDELAFSRGMLFVGVIRVA
jgi:hypothetical protein